MAARPWITLFTTAHRPPYTISNQTKLSSPNLYNGFFYYKSWSKLWALSDFSPDQRIGYFIYQTVYGFDEDWNQTFTKLNRYIHCTIRYDDNPKPTEIIKRYLNYNYRSTLRLEPYLESKNWITKKREYIILINRYFFNKGYRHESYNMDWKVIDIDSSGDKDKDKDKDNLDSGYSIYDIYRYLREGGHI
ncbi:hypothetical protein BDV37DRAFT_269926 [Aspergillus pseudonomiae]|uniref:Uncharacterized protein n=1 Tax=Aspergillus pseudonomiae TaxID=1506151 RepID=A0A5N7DKG0_9EURO|nr:uncharacterized protein BDV37DRAFT_269926 [Aspergillus pseudonomiae]KAE8406599.1 hypothetical protein BDV37DRAFT_269926 [Aspergillus pseudonomiae]